jgi:hypothetical protein
MNLSLSTHLCVFTHVFGENHATAFKFEVLPEVLRFAQDEKSIWELGTLESAQRIWTA